MSNLLGQSVWYWGSTFILGVLLFFPVTKLIWVARVRKLERKLGRKSTVEEQEEEKKKAKLISAFIVITFAFLYNRTLGRF